MLSSDAPQIAELLSSHNIPSLYHFTSVENLPSIIRQDELCSKQRLEHLGVWSAVSPGGNQTSHTLDRQNGLWNLISLSFSPYTPMAYKRKKEKHLCFIKILPEVAQRPYISFSDTNAAKGDVRKDLGINGLRLVNFDAINSRPRPNDPTWHRDIQAEVLVPKHIPLRFVSCVAFISEASRELASFLCRDLSDTMPTFEVDPGLFNDFRFRGAEPTPDFPWVEDLWLSSEFNRGNPADSPRQNVFSKSTSIAYAVADVNVHAGAQSTLLCTGTTRTGVSVFDRQNHVYNAFQIPIDTMAEGSHTVTYLLNDQRWAVAEFQIVP